MTKTLWTDTVEHLLDRTAGADPTPGGGSISMVSAAFGLGLVLMALEITNRRKDAPDGISPLINEGRRILEAVRVSADDDIDVFNTFMSALNLPREKAQRKQAIQEATVKATKVPLKSASLCVAALDVAAQAADIAHPNILSDVAVGTLLLVAAGRGVLLNVDANLGSLTDQILAERFANERATREVELQKRADLVQQRLDVHRS
ncbi:MAG: cyclodeaminase/cyclohydrolase family protein [Pseudomonadota bacterium]